MNRIVVFTRAHLSLFFIAALLFSFIAYALVAVPPQKVSANEITQRVFCMIDADFEQAGSPVHPIFGTECPSGETPTQCSDSVDNDGDGLIDLNDPGCADASDNDESNPIEPPLPACMDGLDNDADGLVDSADPGCASPADQDESDDPATPLDTDGDGIPDTSDNCPLVANPGQEDTNENGTGDACEEIPVVDVCTNIDGVQESVPEGMTEEGGICTENSGNGGSGESDVCPNIDGIQTEVPEGKTLEDGNCVDTPTQQATDSSATPPSGGGGGGGGVISGPLSVGFQGGGGNGPIAGTVLGTSTTAYGPNCEFYMTDYLRMGRKNNPDQVKRLQEFLNEHMNAGLPVTGLFGPLTHKAVSDFQLRYSDEILAPWVPYGLPSAQTSTGYVYKTTLRWINLLKCSSLNIPMPDLSN